MQKKVVVIGAGFSGLSAAACLAAEGLDVILLEKNSSAGGRARKFESNGFTFDMGPSWYWMPDVFEKFFARFGRTSRDFYQLQRLDPSYRIYYAKDDVMDLPANRERIFDLFEHRQPGSRTSLEQFLNESAFKYEEGMRRLVYKPALSWSDLTDINLLKNAWKLNLLQSHAGYVRKFFTDKRLIAMLEFPVLFLGAAPNRIPALYSLMNYADLSLGTWYPQGGMYKVVDAMMTIAKENGVDIRLSSPVREIEVKNGVAKGVWTNDQYFETDFVVAGADYRHVEHDLLEKKSRSYRDAYWDERVLAPSCLIFFVGLNKKVQGLLHHTLFFDEDINVHLRDIYETPQWPGAPQFYVCCPSQTDPTVAPAGSENLFILIPVAPGLNDTGTVREKYFSLVMQRMENLLGESLTRHISFFRSYAHNDFVGDYNAFKGNAYGLANTLQQTANFKPTIRSKKLTNLYFTGQFTVPGPGVPPAIISGQVTADALAADARRERKRQSAVA